MQALVESVVRIAGLASAAALLVVLVASHVRDLDATRPERRRDARGSSSSTARTTVLVCTGLLVTAVAVQAYIWL